MAVYVDNLVNWPNGKGFWKNRESCHMFGDTKKELHAMAMLIGLKIAWFQPKGPLPHYDLTESRRDAAIKNGAIEVTRKFVGARIKTIRIHNRNLSLDEWREGNKK